MLVTRPAHQADAIGRQAPRLGADVLYQPAIEISAPADWAPVDAVIDAARRLRLARVLQQQRRRILFPPAVRRSATTCALWAAANSPRSAPRRSTRWPNTISRPTCRRTYRAEALAEALAPHATANSFFLARASRGREVLAEMLTAAGGIVDASRRLRKPRRYRRPNAEVLEALTAGQIDWTTVTSSAIARSLVSLFGDALRNTKLVAISPLTAEVLAELGPSGCRRRGNLYR